jgi:Fe2+ or Zn2+ uptake regulation protein
VAHLPPTEIPELKAALEAAGRRPTRQRLEVYKALRQADRHPTADELFNAVRQAIPNISLATVYKALDALVESGVATKLPDAGGSARFDARRDDHYHLRCTRSGRVEDLPTSFDPSLLERVDRELAAYLDRRGFQMTGYRLELVGYFREAGEAGTAADRS